MKKFLKIFLIVVVAIVLLFAGAGYWAYNRFDTRYLSFEDDFKENQSIKELTIDGFTFLDRNGNGALDAYEDDRNLISDRVKDLLSQMTMEEKIHLLKGSGLSSAMGNQEPGEGVPGAVGTIVPTPRLGIPTIYLSDGPAGLRIQPTREGEDRTYYCTAFPIATLLASTWDESLINEVGMAMGNEALEYGIDVILGPGANIHRHPLCGRNFEYYSEDPLLSGSMGAAIINGIESNGVGTSVKHFVANNQETERNWNNVIISERALREIYLKGFEIIVKKSQPWTIMSSYNKINGTYTSEDKYLLTDILRDDWGFEGLVMTDWFGGRNAPAQINAGNDLLEPGTSIQWDMLKEAYENGSLTEETINLSAGRILELVFKSRKMQNYQYGDDPDLEAHAEVTRRSAAEGMVLLKNKGVLPMKDVSKISLLGTTSFDFIAGGSGSGDVNEAYSISLEEGLVNAGYKISEVSRSLFEAHKAANLEKFQKPEGMDAIFSPYTPPEISYTEEQLAELAEAADIGIFTIGRNAGEGGDRVEKDDFLLSEAEMDLLSGAKEAFDQKGKKLVVILNVGGVIETASWKQLPDAILLAWQGGQEGGNSVVDILKGVVNPSGKLPMTFPVHLNDHASNQNFPLEGGQVTIEDLMLGLLFTPEEKPEEELVRNREYTHYDEGVYVGYRHFDKAGLEVSYPFGYGLSYTDFEYSNLDVSVVNDTVSVKVTIKNTGAAPGKEVVQLYAEKTDTSIDRPLQELKAFAKTAMLEVGAEEEIFFSIPMVELSYWNEEESNWSIESGLYQINVGASSRDIKEVGTIEL